MDFVRLQRMADNLQKQKCVNTTKQPGKLEQKTVGDKVTKQRPCVALPTSVHHLTTVLIPQTSTDLFLTHHFAGILPSVNPAEDPVPTMHEEPAVRDPESEQESVPVLPSQEVHCCRHEPRW